VLYAAGMIANHFFYDQHGYFDTASDSKPLLHTWTLSVEEQFYIAAPLLAFGAAWLEKSARLRGLLFGAAVVLLLASLLASIGYTSPTRNPAFFLMPFRAWEFIAGGMVPAFIPLARHLPARLSNFAGTLGLAAIVGSTALYSERLLFPSYLAFVPVAGAVLLITIGLSHPLATANRLLVAAPLRWIGLVSYSWYLWHWPLLSFTRIHHFGNRELGADILTALLAFSLAILTYRWVELPIRKHRPKFGRPLWCTGCSAAVVLGLVGYTAFTLAPTATERAQAEWAKAGLAVPEPIKTWWTVGDPCSFDTLPITKLNDSCIDQPWIKSFGFLMGDSHAMTSFATYQEEARKRNIQLITRVDGSCAPLLQTIMTYKDVPMTSCIDGMRQAIALLAKDLSGKIPFAILKASWTEIYAYPLRRDPPLPGASEDTLSILIDRLHLTIKAFEKIGVKRILIIGPEPILKASSLNCLFRADHFGVSRDVCGARRTDVEGERPIIDALFQAAAGDDNVRVIDSVAALCNDTACPPTDGPHAIYVDGAHLTHSGERKLYQFHRRDFEWTFGDKSSAVSDPGQSP
jgi:hypothetical protein